MSPLVDRITAVLLDHPLIGWSSYNDPHFPYRCAPKCNIQFKTERQHAAHVAQRVAAELMSWDFLMALLNEHYPEDVFPTMEDRTDRDTGPRIVSLIRYLDATRRSAVKEKP